MEESIYWGNDIVKVNKIVTTAQADAKAAVVIHGAENSVSLAPAREAARWRKHGFGRIIVKRAKTIEHVGCSPSDVGSENVERCTKIRGGMVKVRRRC